MNSWLPRLKHRCKASGTEFLALVTRVSKLTGGRLSIVARSLGDLARRMSSLKWKAWPRWKSSLKTASRILLGIGTIVPVVFIVKARFDEAADLMLQAEEVLAYRDPADPLSADEARAARSGIDRAHRRDPRSSRAWALGGLYQMVVGEGDSRWEHSALEACRKSLSYDSENSLANYCVGKALFRSGHYLSALKHFDQAVRQEEYWGNAWYYRGRALMRLEQHREAELSLQRARQLEPSLTAYAVELATLYAVQDRLDRAEIVLRDYFAAEPGEIEVQNSIAVLLYLTNREAEAVEALSAGAARSDNAVHQINLAIFLNETGRHDEALPVAERACGYAPLSREALLEVVIAAAGLGDNAKALLYSERLVELAGHEFLWVHANHQALLIERDDWLGGRELACFERHGVLAFAYPRAMVATLHGTWLLDRFYPSHQSALGVNSNNGDVFILEATYTDATGPQTNVDGSFMIPYYPSALCELVGCGALEFRYPLGRDAAAPPEWTASADPAVK